MELFLIALGVLAGCLGLKRKGGKRTRASPDFLDETVFVQQGLSFTCRDLCQGALILGQVGSGKTTGVMAALTDALLRMGCGGLYLCAKPDDRGRLLRACKRAGRSGDVILIGPTAKHRLNFFRTLMRVRADPATTALMAETGFAVFAEMANRDSSRQGGEDGQFWTQARQRMTRSAVLLLILAREEVTPLAILKIVQTIPQTPNEARTPEWKGDFCGRCMLAAFANARRDGREAEFDAVSDFFLKEIPTLGSKTKSNIVAMISGVCDSLTKGKAAEVLATDSTFDLAEAVASDKVVIVDFDYGTWDEIGRYIAAGIKYLAQRELLRREVGAGTKCWPCVADEYQNVLTEFDFQYVSMQRSYRAPLLACSQGIESLHAALGGERGRAKVETLVGNLGAKFVCSPTFETAKWITEQLGREKKRFFNASGGSSGPPQSPGDFLFGGDDRRSVSANAGFSESMELVLQPNQLAKMATGGPKFGFKVGCLFLQPGRARSHYWLEFQQERS